MFNTIRMFLQWGMIVRVIALQGKHDTSKTRTLKGLKEIAAPEDQAAVNEKQAGELAEIINKTIAKWR